MPLLSFRSVNNSPTDNLRGRGAVGLEEPAEIASTSNNDEHPLSTEVAASVTEVAARTRPRFLTFTRKVLLSFMGIGLISAIVGSTMGTTRSAFTASVSNGSNTFAAGTLTMTNSIGTCSSVVAASCGSLTFNTGGNGASLNPGDVVSGTVQISNPGNLPATYTLSLQNMRTSGSSVDLNQYLNLTISDSSGYCIYGKAGGATGGHGSGGSGACGTLTATTAPSADYAFANVSNLTVPGASTTQWAGGESAHTMTFTVQLPNAATTPAVATAYNSQVEIDFVWTAVQ